MEQADKKDLARIKDLLRHTSEFIAYFEVAESKMLEWRSHLEDQTAHLAQQRQLLNNELENINSTLSEAGVTRFRTTAEHILVQGEAHLKSLERSSLCFMQQLQQQHEQTQLLTAQCIEKIEQHTVQAVKTIKEELAHYDAAQFHRVANESCDHVERIAHEAVRKSNKLIGVFQLRYSLLAVFTTIVTAFILGLYLSDELPWEMHHQAMNERQAGKILLEAWPKLSRDEKAKIVHDDRYNNG
jgi:hypothetical protein